MTVLPRSITPPPTAPAVSYGSAPPPSAPRSALERALGGPETPFTKWLVRWRLWFFVGLAMLIVVQFNGQWRLGLDTSLYRGVADNLAAGKGYTFAGLEQKQVYPGLPWMLAAMQMVFQTKSLILPLIVMNGFALLTLLGVYQLIKLQYPQWIAVVVTCGVGMNARFLIQSQEIMTDAPFLCAVVFAMLAWEWLGQAKTWRQTLTATTVLAFGLFIAATMRPTFWVLAAAWAMTAAWNVVRHREKRSIIALVVLLGVLGAFMTLDPRTRGLGVIHGAYEKQILVILPDLAERVRMNAPSLFTREIPEAFFNELMSGIALPFTALLLGGALLVTRRQPLWGLQVLILTGVMLAISDVPRYYLMVLPTLWLGYVLAILWVTSRAKPIVRDLLLFTLFSIANFQNLGGAVRLAIEQHSHSFIDEYKHGSYKPLLQIAKLIHDKVGPNDVVVGPSAQVLSYFSERQVVNGRILGFDTQKSSKYPAIVAAAHPKYLVGPAQEYDKKDADLYKLLIHGVVQPGNLIAGLKIAAGQETPAVDVWLAEAKVVLPQGDWRETPRVRPYPTDPSRPKRGMTPEEAAHRRLKAERARQAEIKAHKQVKADRAVRAEYLARKARKLRKARKEATSQPTTLLWPAGSGNAAPASAVAPLAVASLVASLSMTE